MAITELRRVPNPVFSRKWVVDGSTGNKYVVSMAFNRILLVDEDSPHEEWSCGCQAWLCTSPPQDCKHILQVKLYLQLNPNWAKIVDVPKRRIKINNGDHKR